MGSGGGGGGGNPALLMQAANPMRGLPIAGQSGAVINPYEYGKFQSFLPDINEEGPNPMATGLKPDMFQYKSPSGVVAESGAESQINDLRTQLAALQAQRGPGGRDMSLYPYGTDMLPIGFNTMTPEQVAASGYRGGGFMGGSSWPDDATFRGGGG